MPKFARPNSYNGRQATINWTGDSRFATDAETIAGASDQLAVSPQSLAAAVDLIVAADFASPPPLGNVAPNTVRALALTVDTKLGFNTVLPNPSLGTATLVGGTVVIANTQIDSNDLVICFHISPNASTAIGTLTYVVLTGATITINSLDAAAALETGDLSTVGYMIVSQ